MPRLSAEARNAVDPAGHPLLKPSQHLGDAERKAWRTFVGACPAGHLTERDRPLVEHWVTLSVASRKIATFVS